MLNDTRAARSGKPTIAAFIGGFLLLAVIACLLLGMPPATHAQQNSPNLATPAPASLAYVTGTALSPPTVWALRTGASRGVRLGPGTDPLLSPNGLAVAVSAFGSSAGLAEKGPALLVYSTTGALIGKYLNLATATAQLLAWSPDSRYLAVALQSTTPPNEKASGIAVIDTTLQTVSMVAQGQIDGASFAPDGSDRLVYGRAPSLATGAPVNLYVAMPGGTGIQALTSDGRSLNPIWGPRYIAYDRERLRRNFAPRYDIWLRSPTSSASARRLTNVPANKLVVGLVPLAFSAAGSRLLAEFEGQDTSEAWTVRVPSGRARRLTVRGRTVQGVGISRDGRSVLIEQGSFENPPSNGRIASIPFAGGRPRVLVAHGAQASWNR